MKDVVYFERANARTEYWTYSAGQRVYVSAIWVHKHAKSIKLVEVL